jgi:hypothetical protein
MIAELSSGPVLLLDHVRFLASARDAGSPGSGATPCVRGFPSGGAKPAEGRYHDPVPWNPAGRPCGYNLVTGNYEFACLVVIATAKRRVSDAVMASGTSLLELHGVGPIVAGFILGHVGDRHEPHGREPEGVKRPACGRRLAAPSSAGYASLTPNTVAISVEAIRVDAVNLHWAADVCAVEVVPVPLVRIDRFPTLVAVVKLADRIRLDIVVAAVGTRPEQP